MKPLHSLGAALVVLSFWACGKNTPGMGKVHGQTGQEVVIALQAQPGETEPVVGGGDHQSDEDIYGPQFVDHSDDLLQLLSDIKRTRPISKKENPSEGIDRPYIQIGETIIYPYLDTMGGRFLSKIIDGFNREYLVIHDGDSEGERYAHDIVRRGWILYLELLRHGKTVEYLYVHKSGSIKIRDADSTQVQEAQ